MCVLMSPSSTHAIFIGTEFTISTAAGAQYCPSVTYDPVAKRFFVIWVDSRSGSQDIYGQFVSPTGVLLGGDFTISTAGSCGEPSMAYDPVAQQFLVVWQDDRGGAMSDDIYGQLISSTGALIGGEFTICTATMYQYFPSVAYDPVSQHFLVVWEDYRSFSSYDIYGQLISTTGAPIGGNFPISAGAGEQWFPFVAYDPVSQDFLVVWTNYNSGAWGIYGQRVSPDGTLIGGDIAIFNGVTPEDEQWDPSVTYDPESQRFLVSWLGRSINYGQFLNTTGTLIGGDFSISTKAPNQRGPSIAYGTVAQRFLVLWEDNRFMSGTSIDIYGQLVSQTGTLIGRESHISWAANVQERPSVAYDPVSRRFLAAWQDNRSGASNDIYGRLVKEGGITTGELPSGTTKVPYAAQLQAEKGALPYSWILTSGTLPTGLTLTDTTGEISGTPISSDVYPLGIQVTEAEGFTDIANMDLLIGEKPTPPSGKKGCGCTIAPDSSSLIVSSIFLSLLPMLYAFWRRR